MRTPGAPWTAEHETLHPRHTVVLSQEFNLCRHRDNFLSLREEVTPYMEDLSTWERHTHTSILREEITKMQVRNLLPNWVSLVKVAKHSLLKSPKTFCKKLGKVKTRESKVCAEFMRTNDKTLKSSHLRALVSTMSVGFLYSALLRCSSTSLGVTQMTCWPFQYLTKLRD